MTPQDFKSLCITLVGQNKWKEQIAILLSVSERRIRYWLAGTQPIPEGVFHELNVCLKDLDIVKSKWIKGVDTDNNHFICHTHYPCFFYNTDAKKIYPLDAMSSDDMVYYKQKIAEEKPI